MTSPQTTRADNDGIAVFYGWSPAPEKDGGGSSGEVTEGHQYRVEPFRDLAEELTARGWRCSPTPEEEGGPEVEIVVFPPNGARAEVLFIVGPTDIDADMNAGASVDTSFFALAMPPTTRRLAAVTDIPGVVRALEQATGCDQPDGE